MLFHQPDTSFKRIKSCWKRAVSHGCNGVISKDHPLAAAWSNALMMIEAESKSPRPLDDDLVTEWMVESGREGAYSLSVLDWFAEKVDKFAKDNMIAADTSLHTMLYQWMHLMPCDPTKLNAR